MTDRMRSLISGRSDMWHRSLHRHCPASSGQSMGGSAHDDVARPSPAAAGDGSPGLRRVIHRRRGRRRRPRFRFDSHGPVMTDRMRSLISGRSDMWHRSLHRHCPASSGQSMGGSARDDVARPSPAAAGDGSPGLRRVMTTERAEAETKVPVRQPWASHDRPDALPHLWKKRHAAPLSPPSLPGFVRAIHGRFGA